MEIRDWSNGLNWSTGSAPTSSDNCIIPSIPAGGVFPAIELGGDCADLTIELGAELITMEPATVTVAGDLTSTGTVEVRFGKLDIAGAGNFGRGASAVDGEIEVDGATTIGSSYTLYVGNTFDANGSFDASGAIIDLGASGNLTLASTVASLGTLDVLEGTVTYD